MSIVALDGMGGDFAPRATAQGALAAARRGVEVLLVGDEARLRSEVGPDVPSTLRFLHAPDAVPMEEHSARDAIGRRDSSIHVGLGAVKRGEAHAFVSLGNTGAVLAVAFVLLGRLPGVERPALAAMLPRSSRPTLLLDVGANAEARATHLVQFARLGSAYMRAAQNVPAPQVALLNIGEEASKGSPLTIEAHALLVATPGIEFVGNAEGRAIVEGSADVIVTDGFTGNVALKLLEGTVSMLFEEVRGAVRSTPPAMLGGLLLRPALERRRSRFDYRRYGGVPLLGVDGIVMVGHGRSDAHAVASAVVTAAAAADAGMMDALSEAIGEAPTDSRRLRFRLPGRPAGGT